MTTVQVKNGAAAAAATEAEQTDRTDIQPLMQDGVAGRAAMDTYPIRLSVADKQQVEQLREIRDIYRADGAKAEGLLGQRFFEPQGQAIVDLVQRKRRELFEADMLALAVRSFDPMDPQQQAALDNIAPNLKASMQDLWNEYQEQRDFIFRMSLPGMTSSEEFARLVRLIGGAEPLKKHPGAIDSANPYTDKSNFFKKVFLKTRVDQKQDEDPRYELATRVLHRFPAFAKGRFTPTNQDPNGLVRYGGSVKELVAHCERICKRMLVGGDKIYRKILERPELPGPRTRDNFDRLAAAPIIPDGAGAE